MGRHALRRPRQPIPSQFRPARSGQHREVPGGCPITLAALAAPVIALALALFRR